MSESPRERFQYEHIAAQIVKEAAAKGMDPVDLADLIRDELAATWGLYVTPNGTSVDGHSTRAQEVGSKPEVEPLDRYRWSEASTQD